MKLDRVIWGILLLFIGGVLLLDNFEIIDFYWRNVWSFWPVFLIILGVNILFSKNNSQTGNIISLGILIITLSFLFVRGQELPERHSWWDRGSVRINGSDKWESDNNSVSSSYNQQLLAGDSAKKTILNIRGGANVYDLKGETDSLFTANVVEQKKGTKFMLSKEFTDSVNTLTFRSTDRSKGAYFGSDGNKVDLYLNTCQLGK
ncbi:MAG: LiaF transmembrane domain-containing protein [Bacteroidia bacterium]